MDATYRTYPVSVSLFSWDPSPGIPTRDPYPRFEGFLTARPLPGRA